MDCGEGVGIAVSAVLGLIVTTSLESHRFVFVYVVLSLLNPAFPALCQVRAQPLLASCSISLFDATAPFALLEVLGREGDGPLEFRGPGRLCFTARGAATALVVETGNDRYEAWWGSCPHLHGVSASLIVSYCAPSHSFFACSIQEVNVATRRHAAMWGGGLLHSPRGVAASLSLVAVSEEGGGCPPRVTLFNAATRDLMYCCATGAGVLVVPRGLCFDHCGSAVVVADACTSRLTIFHASDGSLARHVDLGARTPVDVDVCEGGFLVADSESSVVLVDGATGVCTEELGVEGVIGASQPSALGLAWGVGLVVRSRARGVAVLETHG